MYFFYVKYKCAYLSVLLKVFSNRIEEHKVKGFLIKTFLKVSTKILFPCPQLNIIWLPKIELECQSVHSPLTASITMEVKNNYAYVTTQRIHWNKLFDGMYSLAVMMSISTRTTSKTIDKMTFITLKNFIA